jgi:hypothetical protein
MAGEVKRCENGHTYSANEPVCPYCPAPTETRTQFTVPATQPPAFDSDKTVIDTQGPALPQQPMQFPDGDKTVIVSSPEPVLSPAAGFPQPAPQAGNRKLVGWFVTYDISPYGIDYKLYEGRIRIGRSPQNDIVLAHPGISDMHALLLYRDGKFIIEDQLSTNGTFVNEVSIFEKTLLKNDDLVRIGNITLKLKVI